MFFFKPTAPTVFYTLSLHDALPIYGRRDLGGNALRPWLRGRLASRAGGTGASDAERHARRLMWDGLMMWDGFSTDRKSTRLNSSHRCISYAVFCLKKKTKHTKLDTD